MTEKINDDFLYEVNDSRLELEEKLAIDQYYDQLLVLTAIASYNREEWLWEIRWKQAMMGEQDINIHVHCLAYETALLWWEKFFSWNITLEDFCKKIHRILMSQTKQIDSRIIPWETRKSTVFIWGKTEDVKDAQFIYPPAQAITGWLKTIEWIIRNLLNSKNIDTKFIAWYIHYLLVKLHPFQDWNWRLSRIMAITFLEHFGEKDARWFTFFSEMLESGNKNKWITYSQIFDTPQEHDLTEKIKNGWLNKIYNTDWTNSFEWNSNMDFSDYISSLDIDWAAEVFQRILEIWEEKKELIEVVVETFLKAKSLGGDHILIWKFISKLFDTVWTLINSKDTTTIVIDKEIINSVITVVDWKLKKSSVKNLLILVNHIKKSLIKVWIKVEIHDSFFQKSLELWILSSDIVTKKIQESFREIIS